MKVFLDDERDVKALILRLKEMGITESQEGWTRCLWLDEVIEILKSGRVETLSLDHDLGDADSAKLQNRPEKKGPVVLNWLEEQVFEHGFVPPSRIYIHSMNSSDGASKMMQLTSRRILQKYRELQATDTEE